MIGTFSETKIAESLLAEMTPAAIACREARPPTSPPPCVAYPAARRTSVIGEAYAGVIYCDRAKMFHEHHRFRNGQITFEQLQTNLAAA